MPIPIYAVCKAKGSTITGIGCEVPEEEGRQVLDNNICCKYEAIGEVFHYHFNIKSEKIYVGTESFDFNDRNIEVQINVRSHEGKKTPKLEYLFIQDFKADNNEKFSLDELKKIDYGIKILFPEGKADERKISLDYFRSNLFSMRDFKEVPTTKDLNKEIHEYISKTKDENADIYIFGDVYPFGSKDKDTREEKIRLLEEHGPKGIHKIHMDWENNGALDELGGENSYKDGAILVHFNSKEKDMWSAIFFKFQH